MQILIVVMISMAIAISWFLHRHYRGKDFVETIRHQADLESWRAAQEVALQTNPAALVVAQSEHARAIDAVHASHSCGNASTVQHCLFDLHLKQEGIERAIARDDLASRTYERVQNYYSAILAQVCRRPTRAIKIYPTVKTKVEEIIVEMVAEYRGYSAEDWQRFEQLPPITAAERKRHLQMVGSPDFFRNLKDGAL